MAIIGSGGFQPAGLYSAQAYSPLQGGSGVSHFGGPAAAGPGGLGYGRQMLGDIDAILMLLSLLQQGQQAPTGCQDGGMNAASLGQAGAKGVGATLGQAGAKGARGALKKAPGKAAAATSLKQIAKK